MTRFQKFDAPHLTPKNELRSSCSFKKLKMTIVKILTPWLKASGKKESCANVDDISLKFCIIKITASQFSKILNLVFENTCLSEVNVIRRPKFSNIPFYFTFIKNE